jgi:hypothetical protein
MMTDKELRDHLKSDHGYVQSQIGGSRKRDSLDRIHARSHEGVPGYNAPTNPHTHEEG